MFMRRAREQRHASRYSQIIETKTKAIDSKMKLDNNNCIIFMLLQRNKQAAMESIREQITA
jgi:hypothetical protein